MLCKLAATDKKFKWSIALNYVAILVAFLLLWLPEIQHYWVSPKAPSEDVISALRQAPSKQTLETLASISLEVPTGIERNDVVNAAEELLSGRLQLRRFEPVQVTVPFTKANLNKGLPTMRLHIASLVSLRILLRAYHTTAQEKFYTAARDELLAFAAFERRQILPEGMLWNDHAIASRISPIIDFWAIYRERHDFDVRVSREILLLVTRSAEFLARDDHFTYRTNHGVMQSIALLQISAAFPQLPGAQRYRATGCSRLVDQMEYYISPEGITLEHSAEYHELGRYLLGTAISLFELNGCIIPSAWKGKLALAEEFSRLLWRPDGTLPVFGDTHYIPPSRPDLQTSFFSFTSGFKPWGKSYGSPGMKAVFFPVSGYSIWWHGSYISGSYEDVSQTVIAWSHYPSRAHKHADEMSLLIWSGGQTWVTGTGYWPYGLPGRNSVEGWRGSNAPHFRGEATNNPRKTEILGFVEKGAVRAIDIRRTLSEGSNSLRRQIFEIDGRHWVIVDSANELNRIAETLWTFGPEINLKGLSRNAFLLSSPITNKTMLVSLLGNSDPTIFVHRASIEPFGGWVVVDGKPTEAPAIEVRQPSNGSIAMTVFSLLESRSGVVLVSQPTAWFHDANFWQVNIPTQSGFIVLTRKGMDVTVTKPGASYASFSMKAVSTPVAAKEKIIEKYYEVAEKFPRFKSLITYRNRASWLYLFAIVGQELLFLTFRRWIPLRWRPRLRSVASVLWVGGGIAVAEWYFDV
ncbi:heparinase II/III family protein [Pelomicrobium sp.]|jgi:hypothetical protein|uniref:heparinase II/III family protein n=1 Tax=Pelomicrobium sp. TaxID=2815319 RepID=UPI002FDEF1B6